MARTRSRPRRVLTGFGALLTAGIVLLCVVALIPSGQDPAASTLGTFAPGAAVFEGNSGVLGDTDGDGDVSGAERTDLDRAQTSAGTVRTQVAARKGVSTLLMTPAGTDWWHLVTGLSAQSALWRVSAPVDADWYAYTEGRAYHPLSKSDRAYDAVHVVFATQEDLTTWVRRAALEGLAGSSTVSERGRVLTIVPSWVDPDREPFKQVDDQALAGITVPVAIWNLNVSGWIANRASESVLPADYRRFWARLGFGGPGISWTATSPKPNAVWTGTVTGFDADRVDAATAAGGLSVSAYHCPAHATCNDDQGLADAIDQVWVADPTTSGGEETLKPQEVPAGADVVVNMGGDFRGTVTGSTAKVYSPLGSLAMWVTGGDLMSVQPVVGAPAF